MSGSHRVEDNKVAYAHDGLGFSADVQACFATSTTSAGSKDLTCMETLRHRFVCGEQWSIKTWLKTKIAI